MSGPTDRRSLHDRILEKMRDLAEEVRATAERVHQQALEAHRLTEIAGRHSARGRELSRAGRDEAHAVGASIRWSLDAVYKADRHLSGKDED
jgi:hypothetical protein